MPMAETKRYKVLREEDGVFKETGEVIDTFLPDIWVSIRTETEGVAHSLQVDPGGVLSAAKSLALKALNFVKGK